MSTISISQAPDSRSTIMIRGILIMAITLICFACKKADINMSISKAALSSSAWSGIQIDASNKECDAQVYFSHDGSMRVVLSDAEEVLLSSGPYPTIITNNAIQVISPLEREEDTLWFVSSYTGNYLELTYQPKSPFERRLKLRRVI